jgi:amphi-Trp domain-containing protein
MSDMVELPNTDTTEQTVVTEGYFEREVRLSAADTAALLRDLADQVEDSDELTISSDDWEIPFSFGEPIEVEVEFIGDGTRELELELEFEWAEADSLSVE